MRKIYFLFLLLFIAFQASAQTVLISPTGDGGFESGPSFAANGWTVVNPADNALWQIGTAATGYTTTAGAFIGPTASVYSYSVGISRTCHLYRDVAIPTGATGIQLTWSLKGSGETGWDRLLVYTAPTSVTPVANVPAASSTALSGATLAYTQGSYYSSYTTQSVTLSSSLAGTTVRLIFTWQNDASGGTQPPAAIDNISLVYTPPSACSGTPTAGTVVASPSSGCSSYTSSLSLSGSSTGVTGLTYQWQSSPDNSTWSSVSGATNNTYSASVTTSVYYRCQVRCTNSGITSNTAGQLLSLYTPAYASLPFSESFEGSWINGCNTADVPASGYWKNTPATGNPSWRREDDGAGANTAVWSSPATGSYSPAASAGSHSARFHSYFASSGTTGSLDLYVNFAAGTKTIVYSYINNSGTDALICQVSTDGGTTFTTLDAPPAISTTWSTRTVTTTAASSTAILRFKATSDFGNDDIGLDNISVTASSACSGTPTAGTVVASPSSGCSSYTSSLSLSGSSSGVTGLTYQWQSSPDNSTWSSVSGATNNTYSASVTTSVYYRCQVRCTNSGITSNTAGQLLSLYTPAYASLPFSESFESSWVNGCNTADVPSGGYWKNTPATGNPSWRREDDGAGANTAVWTSPTIGSYSPAASAGSHSARFHSYYASSGTTGSLDLYVNFAAGTKSISYSYINNSGTDALICQVSTDGGSTFTTLDAPPAISTTWSTRTVTTTAASSTAILRFKATSDFGADDIGLDNISITLLTNCSGTPTAGSMTTSATTGCGNFNTNLAFSGASSGLTGLTYQWQTSPDNVTWSNIGGATNATYTATVSSTLYYRGQIGCSLSGLSAATSGTLHTSNARPTPSFTTSPGAGSCTGTSVTYTTQSGQSSYVWSVPGVSGTDYSITAGSTSSASNTVTLNWLTTGTKTVTVNYNNAAGCNGTSPASNTTAVTTMPSAPSVTPASISICNNGSATMTATVSPISLIPVQSWENGVPNVVGTAVDGWNCLGPNNTYLSAVTSGASPTVSAAAAGSKFMMWNSYSASNGYNATVYSPSFSMVGITGGQVTFWVYRDYASSYTGATYAAEGFTVYINTSPTVGGTSLGYVPRDAQTAVTGSFISGTSTTTTSGWYQYTCTIPSSFTGATNYLLFYCYSNFGNNCFLDNITVTGSQPVTWSPTSHLYTDAGFTTPYAGTMTNTVYAHPTSVSTTTTINYAASLTMGGCSAITTNTVTINALPTTVTVSGGGTYCNSGTITAANGGSGTIYFQGTTSGGTSTATPSTSQTITSSGTYYFRALSAAGCWGTEGSATVTINPLPTAVTASGAGTYCNSTTITASNGGSGTIYFQGTTSGGTSAATPSTSQTVSSTGTYYFRALSAAGCWGNEGSVAVTINPLPTAVTASGGGTYCNSATITAANGGSGTIYFQGTTSGGTSTATPSTSQTITSSGTYYFRALSAAGCWGNEGSVTVTINPLPAAITGTMQVCPGTSSTLSDATSGGTWSSSNTLLATAGSTTGVVTGVAAGTLNITYTLPTGCFSTTAVTVNPLPAAIGGATAVCMGLTTTLTDASPGGTWASGSTSIATIGSTTALVTGVTGGVANITYTLPTGCLITRGMTVNPVSAITGTTNVCSGFTTTLSDALTGGTWLSANTTIATVGSTTGIVTGATAGTTTITYTLPTGCTMNTSVTVIALPVAITGTTNVCAGLTTTLSDATSGGTWSSNNTSIATVGSTTGTVTGVTAGATTITYRMPSGCFITTGLTVNPLPAAIGGTTAVCVGLTTTLTDASSGGTWSSGNTALATIGSTSGIATGISAGTPVITYTLPTGCIITQNLTVNPLPAAITGASAVCAGLTTTFSDASSGGTWSSSNTALATINSSTGLITGVSAGNPRMTYTLLTGCITTQTITVNPLPAAITGTTAVCVGLTTTLSDATGGGTWSSSSTALATVGSTTGIVTGVLAGTPTITYMLPTGCISTTPVTVNPLPATITGTMQVCVGLTTTLGDATSGGTWSSSNAALATIGASTGTVTGVSAGNPIMTYTLGTGCIMTAIITVNPLPAAITGSSAVCMGQNTTLSDASPGGTWSSSDNTIAVIGSTSGIATGVLPYFVNITYTLPTSCITTTTLTVNPLPSFIDGSSAICTGLTQSYTSGTPGGTWSSSAIGTATIGSASGVATGVATGLATLTYQYTSTGCYVTKGVSVNLQPAPITGAATVCVNSATTLSNAITGGAWTSSDPTRASVGSASGIVTGIAAGTATMTYTLPAGCFATAPMTINPIPAPITGASAVCVNSTITLTNATGGGRWSSSNTSYATVGSATGIVTGIAAAIPTISYILPTGCYAIAPTTVNALPNPNTVTGGGPYCSGGTGYHVYLNSSANGINYQLYNGGSTVGSPLSGTGSMLDYGFQTDAGVYTIVGSNAVTGCSRTMSGSATITVNPLPDVYNLRGGGQYCAGGTGVDIYTDGSDLGITYQLYNGSTPVGSGIPGTNAAIDFGLQLAPGIYTVVATNDITSCTNTMRGRDTVTINLLPAVHTVTGGGNYCPAGAGVHVGVDYGEPGINYQLFNGGAGTGTTIAGASSGVDFGLQTIPGTYTVVAVNALTGCTQNMSGSADVGIYPLPAAYAVTGGGNYCTGGTGLAVGVAGSGTGVHYQLYNGTAAAGVALAGTGTAISFGTLTAAGSYTVKGTNDTTGCTNDMTGGVAIVIDPLPTAYTVGGGGNYCAGGTGVAITLGNSTAGTSYRLYNDTTAMGSPVAGTGSALNFGLQTVAGNYTVRASNLVTGCRGNMSGSVSVVIDPLPSVYAVTGGGNYCAGGPGMHVGLTLGILGVNYQLYRGSAATGITIAGGGSSLDFGLQTIAGTYTAVAVDATTGCSNNMAGSSSIVVNALPVAYIVAATGSSYCVGGTGVNMLLGSSEAGINYQLYHTSTATGSVLAGTGGILDFGPQTLAGGYTITGTNPTTGCTNNMIGGASIAINPLPSAYPVTGGGNFCAGGTGLPIGLTSSDHGIRYQLMNGSVPVGSPLAGTGASLNFGIQTAAGSYNVVATNTTTSCNSNMSGAAHIVVDPLPVTYTVTGGGSYCAGGAGLNVGLGGSQAGIGYQLYNASTPVGSVVNGTGGVLDFGLQASGTYTVRATNAVTGCRNSMTGSTAIASNPLPVRYTVYGGGSLCAGGTGYAVNLSGSNMGINYQLFNGSLPVGTLIAGTGSALDFGRQTTAGSYTVMAVNGLTGCSNSMTSSAPVTVNPLPNVYSVTGGGNYCAGGAGVHIGISTSDFGISYQLYRSGSAAGGAMMGAGIPLDFGSVTTGGSYTMIATNSVTGCRNNMTGSAVVAINPLITPAVTVSTGIGDTVCESTPVTFIATPVNGGSSPAYQWKVNGALVALGSSYSYTPANGDLVTVTLRSSEACATGTANHTDAMTVKPFELPAATITADHGNAVCAGTAVTFTAATENGGQSPVYTWLKNSVAVGTGSSYTYTPADGDVIVFMLGSSYPCRLADHVFSNDMLMSVDVPVQPSVTITASPGTTIAAGQSVTLHATVANGNPGTTYQWILNKHVIIGATNSWYESSHLADNDSVTCVVVRSGPCGDYNSFNSVIFSISNVGVKQINTLGSFTIAPNPSKGQFVINGNTGNAATEDLYVEITDLLGQVVHRQKIVAANGRVREHIELKSVANGMYLINLRSESGNAVFPIVIEQ